MNIVAMTGRLTKDADIRQAGDSNVINFSICNDDESKKDQNGQYTNIPSFFDCSVWSKTGKLASHLLKGKEVVIKGELKQETWKDRETNDNRSKIVIRCREVKPFVYEKANEGQPTGSTGQPPASNTPFINQQPAPFQQPAFADNKQNKNIDFENLDDQINLDDVPF